MARIATIGLWLSVAWIGAGRCTAQSQSAEPGESRRESVPNVPAPCARTTDAEGQPLPAGVLARLGSVRWRHGARIIASALSPDGKRLATASLDSVAVWDVATGKVLFRFPAIPLKERRLASANYSGPDVLVFSPDGKRLGCTVHPGRADMWQLDDRGSFRCFGGANEEYGCRFTRDGKQFVLVCTDGLCYFDTATGKLQRLVRLPRAIAALSADTRMYVRIDHNHNHAFNLRNAQTGATIKELGCRAEDGEVLFAPDSKALAVTDWKKMEIRIWDLPAAKLRCAFAVPKAIFPIAGNTDVTWSYHFGFTADSKVLLMGIGDGTIFRWDLTRNRQLPNLGKVHGGVAGLHRLPDGNTLIIVGEDGVIRHWDVSANRERFDLGRYQGSTQAVLSLDGRLAAVGDGCGRVDLWEMPAIKLARTLRNEGPRLNSLAFSPDGKTLAVGLETETVSLYNVVSGRVAKTISFQEKKRQSVPGLALSTLLFSPAGRFLCVDTSGGELLMWDLAEGKASWRTAGDFGLRGSTAAFAPDGKSLAFSPVTSKVAVLDARTGKARWSIAFKESKDACIFPDGVVGLLFAPDGRRLAAALADGRIVLLDAHTAKELMRLPSASGHDALAFSPDGRSLAASLLESIRVWDTITGKMVLRLDGHAGPVKTIAFGADGRTLLSAGEDSQVYLWTLRPKSPGNHRPALDSLWTDLGNDDAAAAYRAIWTLSEHAGAADFLRARIAPLQPVTKQKLAELIADLDDASFDKREAATHALAELGDQCAGCTGASAQAVAVRGGCQACADAAASAPPAADRIGIAAASAVQAIDLAATPASRRLLEHWSQGADGARLTEAARRRCVASSGNLIHDEKDMTDADSEQSA